MAGGRPSTYDKEIHPAWAWGLAVDGLTDKEIAKKMCIGFSTLNAWKVQHQEFQEALKQAKEPVDATVKQSLLKRATGFSYTERKQVVEMDAEGNTRPVRIETTTKHVPPDTAAAFIWLKNRDPENWRDRRETAISTDIEDLAPLADLLKAAKVVKPNAK